MCADWNTRGHDTARGRRMFRRRGDRNQRWSEEMEMERAATAKQASSQFVLPRGFSPSSVRARGRARAAAKAESRPEEVKTAGVKAREPVSVMLPEVTPVNIFYQLPIHTRGFITLCREIYGLMSQELDMTKLIITEQEFVLAMSYFLNVKLARVAQLTGCGQNWLSDFQCMINFDNAVVPVMIARYLDCLGKFTTAGGVQVIPVVDVEFNQVGWPVLHDNADVHESNKTLIPLALAGAAPNFTIHGFGFPQPFRYYQAVEVAPQIPLQLAFNADILVKWTTVAHRLKRMQLSEVGSSIDGSPSLMVTCQKEEPDTGFVTGCSVENMEPVHMLLGGLFCFHERDQGQIRESRSLVWGRHFETARIQIKTMVAAMSMKPP